MDRNKDVPEPFLRNFMKLAKNLRSEDTADPMEEGGAPRDREPSKPTDANRTGAIAVEELAWADAAIPLSVPGPGLGGPPVRATGTSEQKERFFGVFKGMDKGPLRWGAYALTEPGAGSDVAGIRT